MFFYYKIRNIFRKFEEVWLKIEGEDGYFVIFLVSEKIDPEKIAVNTFVFETFYKIYNVLKVKKDFLIL